MVSADAGWDQQQRPSAEPDAVPHRLRERPWVLCGHLQPGRPELLPEGVPQHIHSGLPGGPLTQSSTQCTLAAAKVDTITKVMVKFACCRSAEHIVTFLVPPVMPSTTGQQLHSPGPMHCYCTNPRYLLQHLMLLMYRMEAHYMCCWLYAEAAKIDSWPW